MVDLKQAQKAPEHQKSPEPGRALAADLRDEEGGLLQRRVLDACDAAGSFIEYWGFKAVHGRVWTLIAISKSPLSQVDVADRLGISRSLVSQAIAELEGFGLVRPIAENRKAPYVAVLDVWPTIADVLRKREWRMIERSRQALEAAAEEVELNPDGPYDLERLRLLLNMSDIALTLVGVLIGLRVPSSLERVSDWVTRAKSIVSALRRFGQTT